MGKLFTGTFFKLALGFVSILAISFIILIAAGYYDSNGGRESEDTTILEADVPPN